MADGRPALRAGIFLGHGMQRQPQMLHAEEIRIASHSTRESSKVSMDRRSNGLKLSAIRGVLQRRCAMR